MIDGSFHLDGHRAGSREDKGMAQALWVYLLAQNPADSKVKCNTLRINERGWSAGGY